MPEKRSVDSSYWRTNLRYVTVLLVLWFVVSYGCGIIFVDTLDRFRIGGFKFGFWMAQQGSIYSFVVIVFIYVQLMNRLERKYTIERRNAE